MDDYAECGRCSLYMETRGPRIKAEIAKTSKGSEARLRYHEFMGNYHALHRMAGRYAALMAIIQEGDEAD